MERDCESELSKLNIEQNACIYHFGASVIHGQRSNILRLRNNLSVTEPMKLSVGSFHLTIPNGTDPQLLAQTLRIVKELEC